MTTFGDRLRDILVEMLQEIEDEPTILDILEDKEALIEDAIHDIVGEAQGRLLI